jgi:hypothetical protein
MVSVIICAHAGAKAPSVTSDAAPLPASSVEGTAREDKAVMPIGIGKYAVILELLTALQALPGPVERNSRMRSFLDKIESKVSAALLEQVGHIRETTSYRIRQADSKRRERIQYLQAIDLPCFTSSFGCGN